MNDIRSDSEPQLSAIFLYFNAGTNELHARQLVEERLQTTAPSLPTWCDPPQVYPIVSATSRIMQIGLTSTKISPMDLSMISQCADQATADGRARRCQRGDLGSAQQSRS